MLLQPACYHPQLPKPPLPSLIYINISSYMKTPVDTPNICLPVVYMCVNVVTYMDRHYLS